MGRSPFCSSPESACARRRGLALLLLGAALLWVWRTQAAEVQYLVVASAEPYQIPAPLPSAGPGIHSSGVISEVLREAFAGTDHVVVEVHLPLKRMVQHISDAAAPVWISYGSTEWSRGPARRNTRFLGPVLFEQSHSLVSLASRQLRIGADEALRGHSLVLIRGYRYGFLDALFRRYGVHAERANSDDSAIKMLAAGRGDFYLAHDMKARWVIARQGMTLETFHFQPYAKQGRDAPVRIAVSQRMAAPLREHLEQRLQTMADTGRLAEILARY